MIYSKTSSSDLQTEDKVEVNFRQPFVNIDNNQNNFLLQKENVSFFVQKSRDFMYQFIATNKFSFKQFNEQCF